MTTKLFSATATLLMLQGGIATKAIAQSTALPPASASQEALSIIQRRQNSQHINVSNLNDPMSQVTSVNQLRDVEPTSWAYEALRSLVERYGCIVGYPDRTFRGDRALSRWEFASGLNACLNVMERLIQEGTAVLREDIDKLKRLLQEFEAELAALGARIDQLEGRVATLEDHQFSTTTKLTGEVIFAVTGIAAGEKNDGSETIAKIPTFGHRTRLELNTSFTGQDLLYTRLANDPTPGNGLFNGPYAMLAQLGYVPNENFAAAFVYNHGYNTLDSGINGRWRGVRAGLLSNLTNTTHDTYSLQFSWKLADNFVLGGWGGLTKGRTHSGFTLDDGSTFSAGHLDLWNCTVTFAFPDLGKEGSTAGIIIGNPPWVSSSNIILADGSRLQEDTAFHIEAFYEYALTDNLSVTPGIIVVTSPDNNSNNSSLVIGVIRTTFTF